MNNHIEINERIEQWKELKSEKNELEKQSSALQEAIELNKFHIDNHNLTPEKRQKFVDNAVVLLKEKTNVDVRAKNLDRRCNRQKEDALNKAVCALKNRSSK